MSISAPRPVNWPAWERMHRPAGRRDGFFVIGLLATVAVTVLVTRLARRELKKKTEAA